jgi:hypothetical protein
MTYSPGVSSSARDAIAKLCLAGDHACTAGDLTALREVASQLAELLPEPLHCELARLAAACGSSPAGAMAAWDALKVSLYREVGE